ncbi:MAG: N-acetylmuramoyl-L-alanine amidase [Fusobacteriaceae bacterium]|jgi:N-acetyl-anhydromuramyl-L-alanine amidase AmpD|nr:N-acetylmuramoyl-L-alanine amidase [Fusobacteriaceae bacterium]
MFLVFFVYIILLPLYLNAYEEKSYFDKYGNPSVFSGYLSDYEGDSNLKIDNETYKATGADERIKSIILHYTATDDEVGKRSLVFGDVSSHYLITSLADDPIYSLVEPNGRSWHAGLSSFYGRENLNDTSIGIEIVNMGMEKVANSPPISVFFRPIEEYIPYSDHQIKKVAYLLTNLINQYGIDPKFILGHSDIAPSRKFDPGPKFPWEFLYREYNIGAWYNEKDKVEFLKKYSDEEFALVSPKEIKIELFKYGYNINLNDQWDESSKRVLYAFQCHFNPDNITGEIDKETYAILLALNKKYSTRKVPDSIK